MRNRFPIGAKPMQRLIAVMLLIAALGLPGYLVLTPHVGFGETEASR